jgi:hypothetical protein
MNMNGVRSPIHNRQNDPSQKPSAYPTATNVCETKHYQAGATSLLILATVECAKTHYICMKSMCYEYEWGEVTYS